MCNIGVEQQMMIGLFIRQLRYRHDMAGKKRNVTLHNIDVTFKRCVGGF